MILAAEQVIVPKAWSAWEFIRRQNLSAADQRWLADQKVAGVAIIHDWTFKLSDDERGNYPDFSAAKNHYEPFRFSAIMHSIWDGTLLDAALICRQPPDFISD